MGALLIGHRRIEEAKETTQRVAEAAAAAAAERAVALKLAERRKVFADSPECMQLAESILEGTIFNLMKENQYTHEIL